MRPLILTPLFPPAVGGAATYFGQIASLLADHPDIAHLTLLTEQAPGLAVREEQGKLTILRLLPRRVSIPTRPYPIHAATYGQTQFWFYRNLPKLVQNETVDLIHFHTRYRGRFFYDALARSRVPVVADLRDKLSDSAQLARVSRLLMCCCEGVRAFALAGGYPADRVRTIPVAFDPPTPPDPAAIGAVRAKYGIADAPTLLFLGDMNQNKGVLELLPAFNRWRVHHPDVTLLLAGVNRLGRGFTDLVATTPNARYLGGVSHIDALALIADARIVLLPSKSEGLPRVMLEALSLGKRVLAPPDIPEFQRYIPDYVLPEVSVSAIVETLDRIWDSPPPPPFPIEHHRFGTIVSQILDVYQELLKTTAYENP